MPAIVRRLLVIAAVDGLLLQPATQRAQKPIPAVQIEYSSHSVKPYSKPAEDSRGSASLEAHGIVGIITVASASYLISISSRKEVAKIRGKPVYVVDGVAIIPLASRAAAKTAIDQANRSIRRAANTTSPSVDTDVTDDEEEDHAGLMSAEGTDDDVEGPSLPQKGNARPPQNKNTPLQDVIGKKGQYGRFAEKWFSKKGWSVDQRRLQVMSSGDDLPSQVAKGALSSEDGGPDEDQSKPKSPKRRIITRTDTMATAKTSSSTATVTISLLPKLLHTTKLLLGSHSFYFSYDFDITRQLGRSLPQGGDIPLYKIVDPLYHWNRHLSSEFADAGQHAFVLPLMQGFVGQRAFTVNTEPSKGVIADVKEDVGEVIELQDNASVSQKSDVAAKTRDFLVTLISRRSIMRPGLRYLRRGVDEEGHAANCVETEQILCDPSWTAIHSFTQLRASMPLFFSQSPYSFKPAPMLQHSLEANQAAFKRHFTDIVKRYGDIQVASLIDKHGTEAKIGNEFEKHINILNEHNSANGKMIRFEWFDFHHACRGMKFENVRLLTESLSRVVKNYGHTVEIDGEIKQTQSGILRVNCMDCLDRTNVVESAFASNALQEQLAEEGVTLDMEADVSTRWYNVLWAENGDAVSKQYSSTAALKGDYTRTRKRDYRGALNDFGLTLTRYYNNIVNDFFSQAAIDFLIGNVSDDVFEEFEVNMMSGDPGMSMRKLRQNAIEKSAKIVIEDTSEDLQSGWTLTTPHLPNSLRTMPFEEVVLLITDAALYAVRFDWNLEKVTSFERIDLLSISAVMRGVYITNTLANSQIDQKRNVGFVIQYKPGIKNVERVNTRSMSTANALRGTFEVEKAKGDESTSTTDFAAASNEPTSPSPNTDEKGQTQELKFLAFKALPARSSYTLNRDSSEVATVSERRLVRNICGEIAKAAGKDPIEWVKEKDIISLAEARKSTGYLEQLGYSLKKLVWA